MSLASFLFCKTRRAQNPNQPRLLSTSCNSWHNMSRAIWQLKATLATFQSCRKRAIVLPDPCSPMTNNAPVPTLFSSELVDDEKEEPLSIRHESSSINMWRPTKAHAFIFSTGKLVPNRTNSLRTVGSFNKRKKKSSPCGPYFAGTLYCVEAVRKRTLSHASRKKANGPLPTTAGTDLTPHSRRLLPHCFHKTSGQLCLSTDFPHTFLCFVQRNNWVLEVFLPQLQSSLISSQNVLFASRIINSSLPVFGCFHGPQGFCLLGLLRLLYTHSPTHYLVGVIHFFPIFSFDAFVQHLAEGIPVSINQGRAPSFQLNVGGCCSGPGEEFVATRV